MTPDKVKALVDQAMAGSKTLKIKGYVSGDGTVADYIVKLIGHEGYLDLIRASLKMLQGGKIAKPAGIPPADWDAAVAEQITSWTRTLQGESSRTATTPLKPMGGYWIDPSRPDLVAIKNLLEVHCRVLTPSTKAATKSAAKTLAKKHIAESAPIGNYNGQMNLAPGKFTDLEVVG